MILPRILVVDDQFARDATERFVFLAGVGLAGGKVGARGEAEPYADVVLSSGQREEGSQLINDYTVVRDVVAAGDWALVLLDVQFDSGKVDAGGRPVGQPGDELFGMTIRQHLKNEFPDLPVVMLTGKRQNEIGETDTPYLSKHKLSPYDLKLALLRYGRVEVKGQQNLLELDASICADAPVTLAAFRNAFSYARADVSVLILGESGTGKEVLARYVHRLSNRVNGPFIAVNVASLPTELVESELFGIGKRIATQVDARPGKFELASGGTLFLDEIGDMALEVQAKVLRALQERKIVRVGESNEIPVDIRLVCATSRDLASLVRSGEFRDDLLYRINTVPITMPPLRERRADIAPLARSFIDKFSRREKTQGLSLSAEAQMLLDLQPFPGNVRELEHLVERLVVIAGHHQIIGRREVIDILGPRLVSRPQGDISPAIVTIQAPSPQAHSDDRVPTLNDLPGLIDRVAVARDDPALKGIKPVLDAVVQRLYQRLAGAALERCRDPHSQTLNRQSAARLLTGDNKLKGKLPARLINSILDRAQEHPIADEDMEALVSLWRESQRVKHQEL